MALSLGDVSKYGFFIGKGVLPEKDLLLQNSIAEKQYKKFDKSFDSIKGTNCAKSNQIYSKDFTFCKYLSTKELTAKYFFDSKQNDLSEFKNSLELFCHDTGKIKLIKEKSQKKIFFKKNCGFCSF